MKNRKAKIEFNGKRHEVEVAETFLQRFWGLSLREQGKMLFKFSKPVSTRVDMMLLSDSLWLYFLDEEKRVIELQKAEPWTLNPKTWKLYSPEGKYSYLLESFEDLGLEKDDEINL